MHQSSGDSPLKSSHKFDYGTKSSLIEEAEVNYGGLVQNVRFSSRERVWTVFVSSIVVSLPALLVGCTLAFPSGALLDLTDLEPRKDFKFDNVLSDIFGVSLNSQHYTIFIHMNKTSSLSDRP